MWIWSGQACALRELGREAAAEPIEAKLVATADENSAAAIMAAACRGDSADIEARLIARLDNPRQREEGLGAFMTFSVPMTIAPLDKKIRSVVDAVRSRPAVQAKLVEFGRPLSFAGTRAYWGTF